MYRVTLGLISLGLLSTAAAAADLTYEEPPVPQPVMVEQPSFSWSGLYGGIYIGYGFGDTTSALVTSAGTGAVISDRKFTDSDGLLGGAFAGYNMSLRGAIVGIEADVEYTGMEDTRAILGGGSASFDLSKQGTIRARLGYPIDRALLYVTGGLAIGDIAYSAVDAAGSGNSDGSVETGYVVGAGVDYAVTNNLFARGEYRWTDYGSESFTSTSGATNFELDTNYHSLRLGLGYKF